MAGLAREKPAGAAPGGRDSCFLSHWSVVVCDLSCYCFVIALDHPLLHPKFSDVNPRPKFRPMSARSGWTLIEIMVVVVIIGLLAALAIPTFMRLRQNAQNSRFMNDLRVFSEAFTAYSMKNGAWPPNVGPGIVPPGMSGEFRDAQWTATTPVGGQWNWDFNRNGITAAISVSGATADDLQMAQIDAKIDDGDLTTGTFIKSGNRYMYILEP